MDFNLSIKDNLYNALDTTNITIASETLALSFGVGDSIAGLDLRPLNTYSIVFPPDATVDPLTTSAVTFSEDATLNFTIAAGELVAGVTKVITLAGIPITTFAIAGLAGANPDTYGETMLVTGEDIQVTLFDQSTTWTFTGSNTIDQVIPDNSIVDITVVSAGLITYTNTVQVYTNEVNANVLMQPTITGPANRIAYPYFFTIIEPCTFNIHVYDGQSFTTGLISYEENGVELDSGNRNFVVNTCVPDTLNITQRIVVREIVGCGGASPIIQNATHVLTYTTTEFNPSLTLNRSFDCCEVLDEAITIWPTAIERWEGTIHDACGVETLASTVLEYTVTAPDGTIAVNTTYTGLVVDAGPLTSLTGTWTPTQLGTYTVLVEFTNCCATTSYTYTYDSCNSWAITNTTCNVITVNNLSAASNLTYTIKELTDYETFENVTGHVGVVLTPGSHDIDLVSDNLYTITIVDGHASTDDDEQIFLLDCNIKLCKKQFLLDVLCDSIDDCDVTARIELLAEFAEFKALEEIIYQKWDEWKVQQSIVDTFSIASIMEDVTTLSKAMSSLLKICNECVTLADEDCGCS